MDDPAAQGRRAARAAAGARPGKRGRPRVRGDRLPSLAELAAATAFTQVTVTRYGKTETVHAAAVTCLWYSVFGTRHVQVVLLRDHSAAGYDLALVTTDLGATPAQVIERYAARWSIEVAIEDAKQEFGAGAGPQPHRERGPPHRPVPARLPGAGHDLVRHRRPRPRRRGRAPRPRPLVPSKARPSTADMLGKLRRVLIAARFNASRPDQPTPEEIHAIRLAWEAAAA